MKAKKQALRLQRRQQEFERLRSGANRMDQHARARMAAGGFRRPGSPKQSG